MIWSELLKCWANLVVVVGVVARARELEAKVGLDWEEDLEDWQK